MARVYLAGCYEEGSEGCERRREGVRGGEVSMRYILLSQERLIRKPTTTPAVVMVTAQSGACGIT